MAAQAGLPSHEPPPSPEHGRLTNMFKKLLGKDNNHALTSPTTNPETESRASLDSTPSSGLLRRVSRKVVPGLPRAKTWKRQQSEVREKLEVIEPTPVERRAVSVDRRMRVQRSVSHVNQPLPRSSAPDFLDDARGSLSPNTGVSQPKSPKSSTPQTPIDEKHFLSLQDASTANIAPDTAQDAAPDAIPEHRDLLQPVISRAESRTPIDGQSTTTSQYDALINDELERKWILNLSMHFRDKSRREKFFVTYREDEYVWRRVTISLDYRNAPDDSLEKDLLHIKFQREKSAKIYEAIRESLQDIQFYATVTNLKLQTTDKRLHVHVVEDVNEIINYPTVRMIQHLNCQRIRERDLVFDSHMSGFVYKVRVGGKTLIKKEIPGPDTVDEFLYEVNALNSLRFSRNVIEFHGVVVDDEDESVKGLLINYAEKGALIDVIYDSQEEGRFLPWALREKWARQIIQGLSDVHEAGFVQGDLTLSNIVIDYEDNAKIIDINRRGCPVGWEPPEATPLIDSNQRISMYIGVKSDLYQLGMVLWALATLEDEPEAHRRPLRLSPEIEVPDFYRTMVEYCLHEDPRVRLQATVLLRLFPEPTHDDDYDRHTVPSISVDDGFSLREYTVGGYQGNGHLQTKPIPPRDTWSFSNFGNTHATSPGFSDDPFYYPSRGRSPPRSLPSNHGMPSPHYFEQRDAWLNNNTDPTTNAMEPKENTADTPREGRSTADVVAKVERDLNELAAEETRTTGGENQTKEAALAISADKPPKVAAEDVEKALPFTDDNTEAVIPADGPTTKAALAEEQTLEVSQPRGENEAWGQIGVTRLDEPGDAGTSVILAPNQTHEVIRPPTDEDGGFEVSNHYTHDSTDIQALQTEASPSRTAEFQPNNVPSDLTGIGSKYDSYVPQNINFSDEDLEPNTTAPTTNVASQA
ncbi:uncharacterized protein GGS22DRAFT_63564 [Annulohypoxylon maeteangense]|uniref:uncharacterized protein n=1 Tax=Annulohypoxylon maeteangense TaxID=1927788 RepID=UPI002007D7CC|nr:uncharacterized protein GGS22DRAFT_63564 [Annulohypoxylon maeteangense]KAI0888833.1 hypothetical protein GGS22DRAFT_63564 [Annulohypoxylon maeteangense]